jgi:hypothetical protein
MTSKRWTHLVLTLSLVSATTIALERDWLVQAGAAPGNGLERNASLKVKVEDMSASRSIRSVIALTFFQGKLNLTMDKLTVPEPINDGIGIFVDFFCAGLPPSFDLGGFSCQQAGGFPRQAQLGNMQIQMIFNGADNNASNNIVYVLGPGATIWGLAFENLEKQCPGQDDVQEFDQYESGRRNSWLSSAVNTGSKDHRSVNWC